MKVAFEFLALFREKAGAERLELKVGGGAPFGAAACKVGERPTVLDALKVLQGRLGQRGVRLLEGRNIPAGMLVFLKKPDGAMTRILDPAEARIEEGECLVLSTAMAGG